MAHINFYLDTRKIKKDGTYPIKLRVWTSEQILFGTSFSAKPEHWNTNEYSSKAPNYKAKNIVLRNLLNKVETYILDLTNKDIIKSISTDDIKKQIKSLISGEPIRENSFIKTFDEYIEQCRKENTRSLYVQTRNKVIEYDPEATFNTINRGWLDSFERHLLTNGMRINSISIHMRNLRTIFNYAIDNEYTTLYPFRKFKIKKEETRKRSLSIDQLRQLRTYPCEDYQKPYRDMFMLMFYLIGINAVDLFELTDVQNGRIEYRREKTNRLYSIKVEPEAMNIINRYRGQKYLLDIKERNNGNYRTFMSAFNRGIRKIGELDIKGQGGKKLRNPICNELTSYWARHTWATIASSLDIPKETISAALGHEIGSRITSIYIDFDQKKIDEANRKVIDYVLNKQ